MTVDTVNGSWFPSFQAILTGLTVGLDGNYQNTHTCKDLVYVYAFGDRVSQMQLAGLAFSDSCTPGRPTGIEAVLAWYRANRVAARQTPIQVQIGTTAAGRFRGTLTHFRGEVTRAEARVSQFGLILDVFPGG